MFDAEQETLFAVVYIIVGIMLFCIIFLIFGIVTQKKLVSLQKKLLGTEILAIERERERLSSDLHDSLAPTISAMILMNSMVETENIKSKQILADLSTYLHQTGKQVREISRNIIPRFYEDTNLKQVILKAVEDQQILCAEKKITVITALDADISLSKEDNIHLYRIIQELISNACKHSRANEIILKSAITKNYLRILYSDNGVGFDPDKRYSGLGLSNISNRINLLKGKYSIESVQDSGTELSIRIPLV